MTEPRNRTPNYYDGFPELNPDDFHAKGEVDLKWISHLFSTARDNLLWYYGEEKQLNPDNLERFKLSDLEELAPKDLGIILFVAIYFFLCLGLSCFGCCFCCWVKCKCCCYGGLKPRARARVGVAMSQPGAYAQPPQSQISLNPSGPVNIASAGEATDPRSEGTLNESESARVDTENPGEASQPVPSENTLKESGKAETANDGAGAPQQPVIQRMGAMGSKIRGKMSGLEPKIITGLMGFWLFLWFLVIIYSFGTPEFAYEAAKDGAQVLKNGFDDAYNFLDKCVDQMDFMYNQSFVKYEEALNGVMEDCDTAITAPATATCAAIKPLAEEALNDARDSLKVDTVQSFKNRLIQIRDVIGEKRDLFNDIANNYVTPATEYLYDFLVFLNIVFLFTFLSILVGMILVWVGKSDKQKIAGRLAIRGGVTAMFILPLFIWFFMIIIFLVQGTLTARVCPRLVIVDDVTAPHDYNKTYSAFIPPKYGEAMGRCKNDETAYGAFNLFTDPGKGVAGHEAKIEEFHDKLDGPERDAPDVTPSDPTKRNVKRTIQEIFYQSEVYIRGFIVDSVKNRAGKCKIGYNAIYSLISLVCIRLPGPLLGYWFLLQFVPFLFIFIIATAYFFERFQYK